MKKQFAIVTFVSILAVNVFSLSTTTYIREKDSDIKVKAHTAMAIPAYLKNADYATLIKKGQEYENAGKWIFAYGTYFDANLIANGDSEAQKKAESIISTISEGNPGKGKFDIFSMHDKWMELITESELYFTEYPALEIELSSLIQKDIHYDTKTADYEVLIRTYFSEKANNIVNALRSGFRKSEKEDWNLHPWFSDGESVIAQKVTKEDFISRTPALEKMRASVAAASKKGIAIGSWLNTYNPWENDKLSTNNTVYCSQKPSFLAGVGLTEKTWDYSMHFFKASGGGYLYETDSFYELEVELCDKNGSSLRKSKRINLNSKVVFNNLNQEIMAKIANGELVVNVTSLKLHYGVLTIPSADTKYEKGLLSSIIGKLPEMKIDLAKTIIYRENEIHAKEDEYFIEDFSKKQPKLEGDVLYYDGYYPNYLSYNPYHPHYKALANRMSIEAGLKPAHFQEQDGERIYDSSKWIFEKLDSKSKNDYQQRKIWESVKTDSNANGFYIESTDYWIKFWRRDPEYLLNQEQERKRIAAEKEAAEKAELQKQQEIKIQAMHEYVKKYLPDLIRVKDKNFEIMDGFISKRIFYIVTENEDVDIFQYDAKVPVFRIFDFCNKLSKIYGYTPVYKLDGSTEFEHLAVWDGYEDDLIYNRELLDIIDRVSIDENANGFRIPTVEEFCLAFGFKLKNKPTSIGGMGKIKDVYRLSPSGKAEINVIPNGYDENDYEGEFCYKKPDFLVSVYDNKKELKLTGLSINKVTRNQENKMHGYDMKGMFRLARTVAN